MNCWPLGPIHCLTALKTFLITAPGPKTQHRKGAREGGWEQSGAGSAGGNWIFHLPRDKEATGKQAALGPSCVDLTQFILSGGLLFFLTTYSWFDVALISM